MADPSNAEPSSLRKAPVKKKRGSRPDVKTEGEIVLEESTEVETSEPSTPAVEAAVVKDPLPTDPKSATADVLPDTAPPDPEPVTPQPVPDQPIESVPPLPSYNPVSDLIPREQLNEFKSAADLMMQDLQDRLSHEEDAAQNLNSTKRKLEGDISNLKKDLENLELSLQKVSHQAA